MYCSKSYKQTKTRIGGKGWEGIVRDCKGWPPNFQPISGMRRCDFPVFQQRKEFTILPTMGARILYSWSRNKYIYTGYRGVEKLSGGSTIFMNTQDSVFFMEETFT